jgi:hypothetical protein
LNKNQGGESRQRRNGRFGCRRLRIEIIGMVPVAIIPGTVFIVIARA